LNTIKVLIFFSRRAKFFFKVFFELHWVLPYHGLNSEFENFETPCISILNFIDLNYLAEGVIFNLCITELQTKLYSPIVWPT
jgi:hypothetical protein